MLEDNEGREIPKNLSENEVKKIRSLADKVWTVMEWELADFDSSEAIVLKNKARAAMEEIVNMFDVPAGPSWKKDKPKPITPKTLSLDDTQKLRSGLDAINEVLEWDIDGGDDEGITMLRDARESLETLKRILFG